MDRCIFWDIDDTLIRSNGTGEFILRQVLARLYGQPHQSVDLAGKTDPQIIRALYPTVPVPTDFASASVYVQTYRAVLTEQRALLLAQAAVQAGVPAVLAALAPVALQSVVTGNVQPIAAAKLDIFQLAAWFDLAVGGYGSDHADRTALVPIALQRVAERYGRHFAGQDVSVIGDTPADIACGQVVGARTVGVATGRWSVADLQQAGADRVFADFTDTSAIVAAVLH